MSNQIQVSVEITSSLGRRLNVTVPAERFEQAVKERIQRIAKTAKIDGFRPGKLPIKTAEKMFAEGARAEATEKLLQSTLQEALIQEKLQPAGYPTIESLKADAGAPLQYTAAFEVFPEVQLKSLDDVTLEKLVVSLTDADVTKVLEQMRKQHAQWEEVQHAAEMSDRVTFDLNEQKGLQLIIEEGAMPAEFIVLKGKKVGDEAKVQWQGKEATVKVIKVEAAKLPEIDNEFAKRLGVKDATVAGLNTEVRQHLQTELDRVLQGKLKSQLLEKLIECNPVELPKSAVDAEYEYLAKDFRERVKKQFGQEVKDLPDSIKQQTQDDARRRVILGLLFPAVIKQFDLKVDDARVKQHVERVLSAFENTPGMIDMVYKDKNIMANIRSQVLEEQVVEKLLEQVKFTEKNATYSEVMKFADHQHDHHHHDHEHVHDENCQHNH